jgi:hypothetical protein
LRATPPSEAMMTNPSLNGGGRGTQEEAMRARTAVSALLVAVVCACAPHTRRPVADAFPASVTVCEAIARGSRPQHPEATIRGTYRYGFEWQELYCLGCYPEGRIWVEWRGDARVKNMLERLPKHAGTANVLVTGRFVTGGRYGHMGAYQAKLEDAIPIELEAVERSGAVPSALSQRDRGRVCQE